MASSSRISCFNCQESSSDNVHFRNGWRLRSGAFAQLCPRCACAYEEGRFCEIFHSNHDGWRDCESCGKLVHCGCIVSFNTHLLLDFGGIICMECSRLNLLLARRRCLSLGPEVSPGGSVHIQADQDPIGAKNLALVSHSQLERDSRNPKVTMAPFFEKMLSASDVDLKLARLFIPQRCAEAFFPVISGLNGLHIKIQDTEGKEWEFQYRCWLNGGSRIYTLEGLRDFMISKRWQLGDTVTLYQVEPTGKLVIGLRKACGGLELPRC